ncbi:MAG: hypothetical protein CML02_01510 [Pseudooceanicola sp.]|jgi:uncharacterized tellurite resistance protein B-like protein|nr:hypothetical protein [Pseudooceanicola sp.]|tara:strand:- start:2209 stop:3063 length:855 start_codon:yes stop_codon:yes gene_type:complete
MSESWFEGVDDIISDDLRFKAKLGIGEDAYTSLRIKKSVFEAWDVAGVAATGAQLAGSTLVAKSFFSGSSLLVALGIGTAATPIGWVVAASILSGGAWFGITRYLKDDGGKTVVVPTFINTPIDVLGLALFDLMAPLAVKVSHIDGDIHESEINTIIENFSVRWGYSKDFVERGLNFVSQNIDNYEIKNVASTLALFARDNPDCNAKLMLGEMILFLREVMEADGRIDEREEMAIDRIERVFKDNLKFSIGRTMAPIGNAASWVATGVGSGVTTMIESIKKKTP